MIADFAIHLPDKKDGGIQNPHFHILCPIRPIEENDKWGYKQQRVYRLDKDGNRIIGKDGKPLFDAVPTTDWGKPETLEHWREVWAAMVNAKFSEKGLTCRIDHRSYERQGVDQLPTVHEGVSVRQMEAKGIRTDKGDLNRWIRKVNNLLREIRRKIAALTDWLKAVKDELSKPQSLNLTDILGSYYTARNAGAWSNKARVSNLKQYAEAVNYLTEHQLCTLEDFKAHIDAHSNQMKNVKASMKTMSARKKELEELLRYADLYQETKPIYTELNGIKWKGKRQKFEEEHERELNTFHMINRKLEKYRTNDGKIPIDTWQKELTAIEQNYKATYEQYKPLQDDLMKLLQMKRCIDTILRQQEQTHQKQQEMER